MMPATIELPARPRGRLLHLAVLAFALGPEEPLRQRVYALVAAHPGLHQRDIARRLDIRAPHAEYHLHQLTRAGLLRANHEGGYVRYFVQARPASPAIEGVVSAADVKWISLLRQTRPLAIIANLLANPSLTMGDLAARVGVSPATLTYHVGKLERAGIVERRQEGTARLVTLAQRDRLVRLLLEHEPPDDLVAGFEDIWRDVGLF